MPAGHAIADESCCRTAAVNLLVSHTPATRMHSANKRMLYSYRIHNQSLSSSLTQ